MFTQRLPDDLIDHAVVVGGWDIPVMGLGVKAVTAVYAQERVIIEVDFSPEVLKWDLLPCWKLTVPLRDIPVGSLTFLFVGYRGNLPYVDVYHKRPKCGVEFVKLPLSLEGFRDFKDDALVKFAN